MPSLGFGYFGGDEPERLERRPGVGQGKGRGVTKPAVRRGKRRRR